MCGSTAGGRYSNSTGLTRRLSRTKLKSASRMIKVLASCFSVPPGRNSSDYLQDEDTHSQKDIFACFMTGAENLQPNPPPSVSLFEKWFEAANWDLNELASPDCQPERASNSPHPESQVEHVSPPTSSCWSFSPRSSSYTSPDNSPATINPLATIRVDFPLSTTENLSDVVPQPRTNPWPDLECISSSATPYVRLLSAPDPDAAQEKRTDGRKISATLNCWKTHASATLRPTVLPTFSANDYSGLALPGSATTSVFLPASDGLIQPASSPWKAQQTSQSPDEKSTLNPREVESESSAEDDESDISDSDDYCPSRSPSVNRQTPRTSHSPPAAALPKATQFSRKTKGKKSSRKAKGSAALALAVVTQLGEAKRIAQTEADTDPSDEDYDPVKVYQDITGCEIIRKRRNQPIPLPIPIPNLNKKSRGRKVPFVADPEVLAAAASSGSDGVIHSMVKIEDSDDEYIPKDSRSKRRKITTAVPSEDGLERSYVCVIPGCGKCFVRGEHLKRHVRSIHTHDKPHRCPIEGCDKSFSRRDNLGQHVRIHLQS